MKNKFIYDKPKIKKLGCIAKKTKSKRFGGGNDGGSAPKDKCHRNQACYS